MQKERYVPGFDLIRLFGSILVVINHYNAFVSVTEAHRQIVGVISVLIPVFFIMSGYLCGRSFSKERVKKQVIKYGSIYLAIEVGLVLYAHIADLIKYGSFSFTGFAVNSLKCLVSRCDLSPQLWFIPALLYPMILNAYLNKRSRKIVIAAAAALLLACEIAGEGGVTALFEKFIRNVPLTGRVFTANELSLTTSRYAVGLLFTTIGFDIVSWKIKPLYLIAAVIPTALFEIFVRYIGISSIILSVLFFYAVKKLPGKFIYPFHTQISIFAGLNFFLHMIEKLIIFNLITKSVPLNLLIIFAVNTLLTAAATFIIKRRRKKSENGALEERSYELQEIDR